MIEQIYTYFTVEMLYYWVNLGVLPFWLVLIFFPQSYFCRYFVTSIFPIFVLSGVYIFILYKAYLNTYPFNDNFSLYLSIDNISPCRPHITPIAKVAPGSAMAATES